LTKAGNLIKRQEHRPAPHTELAGFGFDLVWAAFVAIRRPCVKNMLYKKRLLSILPAMAVAAGLGMEGARAQTGPSISQQPASQTAALGGNTTFSVMVTGTAPLRYDWQLNGTNLPNIITTAAGNGAGTYSGDGIAATKAAVSPSGVAVDAFGDLFVADTGNNRVREVGTNGIITTLAGNGTNGYSGDGGAATNASLWEPSGAVVDSSGNIFIADMSNNRIRKVGTNGIITTTAGNGTNGYSGDGGPATNASLANPIGVVFDAFGNLFIGDYQNNRVRKVDTNGMITTVAGNGTNGYSGDGGVATNASLSNPAGLALDSSGNLYIADSGNHRVREVGTNGMISTVAGSGAAGYFGDGGKATNAFLEAPTGVALDLSGNLIITDTTEHVRAVGTNGIITTLAGNAVSGFSGDGGAPTNAELSEVYGVAADGVGNLFLADRGNNRIRQIGPPGPTIQVSNISTANGGAYVLVVSNAYGSVTSLVATLTVALPPLSIGLKPGPAVLLQFNGLAGSNYVLLTASNLAAPIHWQPVITSAASTNGLWTFTDTNTAASSMRFYLLSGP
jgi:hypothetical protein